MGTVGLSFGSPTSGTGFDVSSTVSEIVSNLQNIETPWKNQLTTLQSQDTVISNLGSLFSALSTDVSQLTDFQGTLAQKTGSSSDTNVLELTSASSSATAGTHTVVVNNLAQTSSGYLAPVASASAALSGSITLQVGSGEAQTITLNSSDDTLSGLASAINSSNAGVTASVLTDADGSRLSLVSNASGAGGNIAISNNTLTAAAANTLAYSGVAGSGAGYSSGTLAAVSSLSDALSGSIFIQVGSNQAQIVDVPDSPDDTLTGLMNAINNTSGIGVTASIVTNSDGTSSLSLTSQTQGSAGTLTVSSSVVDPATALSYSSTVTGANASLTVDGVNLSSASNTVTNLIPGLTFQLLSASPQQSDGSAEPVQVVIANDNSGVETAVNQFVTDYNSLISAIDKQEGNDSSGNPEPLFGSPTVTLLQQQLLSSLNVQNPSGYFTSIPTKANATLSGSITIQVGGNTAETVQIGPAPSQPAANTIYTGDGVNTLSGLADAINSAGIGVTAGVASSNGQSTLTLTSQTDGANGALTVTSALVTNPVTLSYTEAGNYTDTTADSGTVGEVIGNSDVLSGSISIQVGSGAPQTVNVGDSSTPETIQGLATAINDASIGVTAAVVNNSDGTLSLSLTSNTDGSAGALTVDASNLTDTATTSLNYSGSSDVSSLTDLGISLNNDGTMTFDSSTLDALLNSDFSGVVNFFQGANSWGQTFAAMLNNAGSSSSTGILALAAKSNSSIESNLNTKITDENSQISTEQTQLTNELNQANEILQELPSELNGMNELYSAITGYNEGSNG